MSLNNILLKMFCHHFFSAVSGIVQKIVQRIKQRTWIDFSVSSHAVGIDDCLEHLRELVGFMKGRRHVVCLDDRHYRLHLSTG